MCWLRSFQFQFGAIGSNRLTSDQLIKSRFQFQFGAIGRVSITLFTASINLVSIPVWCDW